MPAQTHHATCAHDCPGACALEVEVEDNHVLSVRGDPDHPFTRGLICGKVRRYREVVEGPRILSPLLRDGARGHFREASWDEALGVAAAGLQRAMDEAGPPSVVPYYYGGTLGIVQQKAIERLAHHAGWSRLDRNLCFAIADAGWSAGVGAMLGPRPEEIAGSDLVLLWGNNAVSTHINLMSFVKQARERGARLVVIDPYRTRTAAQADQHLALRPGSDGALACAMMQVLLAEGLADRDYLAAHSDFDAELEAHLSSRTPEWAAPITGLDAGAIRALALAYGRAVRPFVRLGVGMTRQRNGAVNVHAVSCLPTLIGAWMRRGAGALLATDAGFHVDDRAVRRTDLRDPATRVLDMSQLGRWLNDSALDPPVRALVVFNSNPAVSCPDLGRVVQGLQREDLFTVVHEQVLTDTARLADVVLPATTFLEHPDLYASYGQYTLQYAAAALDPVGEARCNHDVVNALAQRLGYSGADFEGDSLARIDRVLADNALPERAWFAQHHWLDCAPDEDVLHFRQGFPTADGRFHFRPGWTDPTMPALPDHWAVNRRDLDEAGRFPLDFRAPPAHEVLNSCFTHTATARRRHAPPRLWLHPDDARARGIDDADRVRVFNERGSLSLLAAVTDKVRAGLCLCETNHLGADFPEALSVNALAHDDAVAPGGGPAFHDNRVEVEKL